MTPQQPKPVSSFAERSPHEIGTGRKPMAAPPPASHHPQPLGSPGEITDERAESEATAAWLAHVQAGRINPEHQP